MQAWLKARGVDAKLLEKRSMNTCENTRFSLVHCYFKRKVVRLQLCWSQMNIICHVRAVYLL